MIHTSFNIIKWNIKDTGQLFSLSVSGLTLTFYL